MKFHLVRCLDLYPKGDWLWVDASFLATNQEAFFAYAATISLYNNKVELFFHYFIIVIQVK